MPQSFDDTAPYATADAFAAGFFVPPPPTVKVTYGGATHPGKIRDQNEDHFAVVHRFRSQHLLLTNLSAFIVTDGIGGAAAGELASRLVMEEAWELSAQASSWVMRFHDLADQQVRERTEAYAARMHEKLQQVARDDPRLQGMGTTWTSAYAVGWDAVVTHIGDSRAYLVRDQRLRQLTRDHTLAQALSDRGMGPEETDLFRHVVTNTLGGGHGQAIPDVIHIQLQAGDRLLLCTDGLSEMVDDRRIEDVLRSISAPQDACDALIEKALEQGGKDNVTVILADFGEVK